MHQDSRHHGSLPASPDGWRSFARTALCALLILGAASGTRGEPAGAAESTTVSVRPIYAEALAASFLFYEAQRSGPPSPRIPWRRAAALTDGRDVGVDLSGGWFDAGDHVKFGLPMAYTVTMLGWSLLESRNAYVVTGQLETAEGNLRFGLDYLLSAYRGGEKATPQDDVLYYQVGDGAADHAFWGPPDRMSMPRPAYACTAQAPCSEVAAASAAALAAGALVFQHRDAAYASQLLEHARQLFGFAELRSSSGYVAANEFYPSRSGFRDELAWAAIWLYVATAEQDYLEIARAELEGAQDSVRWSHSWDTVANGATLLLARITHEPRDHARLERHFAYWLEQLPRTDGGLVFLNEYGSLRYASTTAFLALLYAKDVDDRGRADRYRRFALSQLDYILGDNPRGTSYVVGVGPRPPRNPHHRAAHDSPVLSIETPTDNRHELTGALVGGPRRPDDFAWSDDRRDYVANEVALDYNAGFTGALAAAIDAAPPTGRATPGATLPGAPTRAGIAGLPGPLLRSAAPPAALAPQTPVELEPTAREEPEPGKPPRSAAAAARPGVMAQEEAPSLSELRPGAREARSPDGRVRLARRITRDWGAGYCAELTLSTASEQPIAWAARVPIEGRLRELWNARYRIEGSVLRASGVEWNREIRSGRPAVFGFCVDRG